MNGEEEEEKKLHHLHNHTKCVPENMPIKWLLSKRWWAYLLKSMAAMGTCITD